MSGLTTNNTATACKNMMTEKMIPHWNFAQARITIVFVREFCEIRIDLLYNQQTVKTKK